MMSTSPVTPAVVSKVSPPTPVSTGAPTTSTSSAQVTPARGGTGQGRKGSASGGGKAWTEEEEVYLLQKRLERVAYKKIASHLDKTELACRLHYHQLSHGGNRRKRNNSISSTSSSSAGSPVATSPKAGFSPVNAAGAVQKVGSPAAAASAAASKIRGKPLLPKPKVEQQQQQHSHSSQHQQQQQNTKSAKLKVNCAEKVDKEKLARIVEAQGVRFWEQVAAQYGGAAEPDFLQECWQKVFSMSSHTTTPTSTTNSTAINTAATSPTATPPVSPKADEDVVTAVAANTPPTQNNPDEEAITPTATASEVSTPATLLSPSDSSTTKDVQRLQEEKPVSEDCIMTD